MPPHDPPRPAYEELARLITEVAYGDPVQHIEAQFDTGDNVHQCRYCGVEQPWPYNAPVHERGCFYVRCRQLAAHLPTE